MPHTIVRVLGQWKSSRDIEAMKSVAAAAYDGNPRFEVVGRGWPEVDGWSVDNRFVPEAELDNLIHSSQVVLIPYSRFYQSGIAIRALENNRVTVGPADSSLADILGADSPCLVHDADWVGAVRQALLRSNKDVSEDRNRYEVLTRNEYERFVEEFFL